MADRRWHWLVLPKHVANREENRSSVRVPVIQHAMGHESEFIASETRLSKPQVTLNDTVHVSQKVCPHYKDRLVNGVQGINSSVSCESCEPNVTSTLFASTCHKTALFGKKAGSLCGCTQRIFVAVQINSIHHFPGMSVWKIFLDMFLNVLRCHLVRPIGCERNTVEHLWM